ncbi:EutP/PduV family microcompartment system protein [Aestuariimicrobium sp. p3-SID1156]|uniref:EutP/PduV family microcompartment system protein n=1 Tax=Aestuariimicrobium sp. p3-SID1156 TaxID=2916038 RepID=UPI00223AA919|nr:EutP/PduV family microcompartment system protein [Aestuariimicrobium sp. p3-SID1156]MCT1458335.1 EutP/PduV family microcompartment system protein [Aestuariimicrobium sp. p3-SID1156]
MTRAMLLGPIGCGKTTLAQALRGDERTELKTQAIVAEGDVIDTPGEYVEHGRFNHALLLTSHEADLALLLESAAGEESRVPPGFATMFTCPVLGVVTKVDIAPDDGIRMARERLENAAVAEIVETSAVTGQGIVELGDAMARLAAEGVA